MLKLTLDRDSITPSNLDLVAQEGVTADEEEGDVTGEVRCVYSLFTPMPSIDITLHSSWNVELTDEQASMLQRHVGAF